MTPKNLPAKLLVILAVLFAVSILCANIPALDPVRYTEADATATAIAPALYPTLEYNKNVLPEQQRVEREEITATTRNAQAWQRYVDQARGVAGVVWWGGVALVCIGGAVGLGGTAAARGVREMKRAALPQTQLLVEGPHITQHGTMLHTVTGAVARIDVPQDARPEHARLVSATYEAMPQNVLLELLNRQRVQWREISSNSNTQNLLT